MTDAIADWVTTLDLKPHPEGGYFRETYRDALLLSADLPEEFEGARAASTGIYYLLAQGDMSALHRIKSDELWHHYEGATLSIHVLHPDGRYERLQLGKDLQAGDRPQAVVPRGAWFGARIESEGAYALCGCTVAPGFDFDDFEMATREALLESYPEQREVIEALTRA